MYIENMCMVYNTDTVSIYCCISISIYLYLHAVTVACVLCVGLEDIAGIINSMDYSGSMRVTDGGNSMGNTVAVAVAVGGSNPSTATGTNIEVVKQWTYEVRIMAYTHSLYTIYIYIYIYIYYIHSI